MQIDITKGSKNEQLYEILKKEILSLAIQPGEKISEKALAEKYGVSRSPVRDALRRLEQEQLIIIQPQVGTFVAEVSFDELLEILELKRVNDPLAARFAAELLNPDGLIPIRKKLELAKSIKLDDRYKVQKEFDDQLHNFIFDNCGNRYLRRICRDLFHYSERIRLYTTRSTNIRLKDSLAEAEKILASLERKNPKEAYEATKQHMENVYAAFKSRIQKR